MATRSLVGMLKDGKVNYVYCHFDGYPSGVGRDLVKHYNTQEKVEQLIALGDLSTIGEKMPDEKAIAKAQETGYWGDDTTMSYHLWRGEELKPSYCTLEEYNAPMRSSGLNHGEEFRYLWNGESWECTNVYHNKTDLYKVGL